MSKNFTDDRRKRLYYRAWHRGTREMDLLLGSFADRHLADFDDATLKSFANLLNETDPDLYDWITGAKPPPENPLLAQLIAHRFAA